MSGVCVINSDWKHNHSTENLEASNFKTLSQKSVVKITKLYEADHTPATARQQYLTELTANCENDIDFMRKRQTGQ